MFGRKRPAEYEVPVLQAAQTASASPPAEVALRRLAAPTPPLKPDEEAPEWLIRLHRFEWGVAAEVEVAVAAARGTASCDGGSLSLARLKARDIVGRGKSMSAPLGVMWSVFAGVAGVEDEPVEAAAVVEGLPVCASSVRVGAEAERSSSARLCCLGRRC